MLQDIAKDEKKLPAPGKLRKNDVLIAPFPEAAAPLELYLLRKRTKKTIQQVADILGISKQRYSEIEKGKNLTLKTLGKAALALGASVDITLWRA